MKTRLQQIVLGVLIMFGLLTPLIMAPAVHAASKDDVCAGLADAAGSGCGATGGSNKTIDDTVKLAINIFSFIVGVAAVIMIIVGGFRYVISQGEGANTAGAKNTILYAIVGLAIVVVAQVIVKFVLSRTL